MLISLSQTCWFRSHSHRLVPIAYCRHSQLAFLQNRISASFSDKSWALSQWERLNLLSNQAKGASTHGLVWQKIQEPLTIGLVWQNFSQTKPKVSGSWIFCQNMQKFNPSQKSMILLRRFKNHWLLARFDRTYWKYYWFRKQSLLKTLPKLLKTGHFITDTWITGLAGLAGMQPCLDFGRIFKNHWLRL